MKSSGVSLKAFQVFPKFTPIDFDQIDPTLNVYYEALSVIGAGLLYAINMNTDDGATAIIRFMKVTIDGTLTSGQSANEAGADVWYWLRNMLGGSAQLSKTPGETLHLPFQESLLIEVKFSATLVAGKKMSIDGYYGDI